MIKITNFSTAIFLIGIISFGGCASSVPPIKKVEVIPDGMALIYIYRPSKMGGAIFSYDVNIGKEKKFLLGNGHCYRYFAKPGEVEVWSEEGTKTSVTVDAKPGEVYYLRLTLEFGGLHLDIVPKDTVKPWQVEDCPEV